MLHLHLILPIGFAILHAGCRNKCKLILNNLFAHNKYFFRDMNKVRYIVLKNDKFLKVYISFVNKISYFPDYESDYSHIYGRLPLPYGRFRQYPSPSHPSSRQMYVSEWEWESPETQSTNILMWTASDSSSEDTTLLIAAAIPRLPSQAMSGVRARHGNTEGENIRDTSECNVQSSSI